MKKHALLASLVALMLSPSLLAATTEVTPDEKINRLETIKVPGHYVRFVINESEVNREGKRFTLNTSLFGSSFSASSSAIELGYHLNTNTILSAQYTKLVSNSSGWNDNEAEKDIWLRDGRGHAISIGAKQFVSNSFYFKPEIYSRSQEKVHSFTRSYYGDDRYISNIKDGYIEDVGVSFKIGNQWQWDNFTLGCDWIGITKSVSAIKQTGKIDQEDINSFSVLNFYLGYTM
ncbi:MAG: hypothetical protein HON90_15860 [Halobacteriovoraceae bacterium]|jgi:hypothetical protein|nr:hypothetical protein [Halobacteriovoraceae bacterium]